MNVSFEIITPAGVTIRTCDSESLAKRFVLAHKQDLPGLSIDRVETVTTRSAVYRPRKPRQARAA